MQKEEVLLIFVKNPVVGHVKTRLAKSVGPEKALEIYHKLLDYTREVTRPLAANKQVWYSQYPEEEDGWDPETYEKKVQGKGDLGEKMKNAFREVFHQGYRKAVIIGSDCADLTTSLIEQAFRSLEDHDLVIGPSADGGYYLLGMIAFQPHLFDDIAWSTSSVLRQTIEKTKQHELSLFLMSELNDVDNEADWNEVKEQF